MYDLAGCGNPTTGLQAERFASALCRFHYSVARRQPNAACLKTKVGALFPGRHRGLLQQRCNGVTLYVSILHILISEIVFIFKSIHINILFLNRVPLVRFCQKLQTMPHVKGGPGTTLGTVHHCPGRKIGAYVKMGPCRGQKENGYCLTHQIPCLVPKCRLKHWAKLKNEPCGLCEQRQKVSLR